MRLERLSTLLHNPGLLATEWNEQPAVEGGAMSESAAPTRNAIACASRSIWLWPAWLQRIQGRYASSTAWTLTTAVRNMRPCAC